MNTTVSSSLPGGSEHAGFAPTRRTVVLAAGRTGTACAQEALSLLCEIIGIPSTLSFDDAAIRQKTPRI